MHLKVLLPTQILLDVEIGKITAEAEDGYFTLLPKHVDFATSLAPGIMSYYPTSDGKEQFLATDRGTLIKVGDTVFVSANRAVKGRNLSSIQKQIEREFLKLDDDLKAARGALARLEFGIIRRFMEL